jgi:hypothetical protein
MELTMPRTLHLLVSAALAAAILTPSVGAAQSPPTPKEPVAPKVEQLDANTCPEPSARATVGQDGDVVVKKPEDSSLSDKLARAEGVICPPRHVDPEIKAPTPPGGPTPVIPPPGSPGGDPTVKPK